MAYIKSTFYNNLFLKNYSFLPLSTIVGQGINTLITFYLLKKYYTPADFGLYSNFIALSVFLSCLFSLRLELVLSITIKDRVIEYFNYIIKIIFIIFIILFLFKIIFIKHAPFWVFYSFLSAVLAIVKLM